MARGSRKSGCFCSHLRSTVILGYRRNTFLHFPFQEIDISPLQPSDIAAGTVAALEDVRAVRAVRAPAGTAGFWDFVGIEWEILALCNAV